MTLAKRIHEAHLRLGIRSATCADCRQTEDRKPAWLRNLTAKDMTPGRAS